MGLTFLKSSKDLKFYIFLMCKFQLFKRKSAEFMGYLTGLSITQHQLHPFLSIVGRSNRTGLGTCIPNNRR